MHHNYSEDEESMSADDPLLTAEDIAKLAGVRQRTVYEWKKRNRLPPPSMLMMGRRPVWKRSTMLRWLEATGRKTAEQKRAAGETIPPIK